MQLPQGLKPQFVISKDASRYMLCNALVKDGVLYASNGRTALFALYQKTDPFEEDEVETALIPHAALKVATRRRSKSTAYFSGVINLLKQGWVRCREQGLDVKIEYRAPDDVDRFPNCAKAVPHEWSNPHSVHFNAKLLYELAQAMGDDQIELTYDGDDNGDPMMVKCHKLGDRFGLIMPLRSTMKYSTVPNVAHKRVCEIRDTPKDSANPAV